MDALTHHRKSRLQALIDGDPYKGSQVAFAAASGLSKGRVSQLLDPREPFGERAGMNLAIALGKSDDRYFEEGFHAVPAAHPVEDAHWRAIADHVAALWGNNTISPTKFLLAVDKLAEAIPTTAAHAEVAEQVRRYLFDLSIKSLSNTNA